MMKTVPYTNNTENTVHIGSATIPAGETRDVDPSLLPDFTPEKTQDDELPPNDHLADLLAGNVTDAIKALADLSDEDLQDLATKEAAGKARKSLAEAIAAETLRRADEKAKA